MQVFHYRAVLPDGAIGQGDIEATDRGSAVAKLQSRNLLVLDLALPSLSSRVTAFLSQDVGFSIGSNRQAILRLIQRLALLLVSGITLEASLQMIAGGGGAEAKLAGALLTKLRGGAGLGESMESESSIYPAIVVAVVRAGEAGGSLGSTLEQLAERMGRMETARQALRSALLYPATLLFTAAMAMGLMVWVIMPQLEPIFTDAGVKAPVPVRVAFGISHALREDWIAVLAVLVAIGAFGWYVWKLPTFRTAFDRQILKTPLLGPAISKAQSAKLARTLGAMIGGGVSLPSALALSRAVLDNASFVKGVSDITLSVREGGSLTTAAKRTGLFPTLFSQMVQIGETTGSLAPILNRTADLLEADVQQFLDRLITLLVPTLTFAIGAFVAGLIASVMMVVMSLNDVAQ